MADIESNVKVNIDTTDALSQLKLLQQQISAFQQAMRKAGADNAAAARAMQSNLANSINATGKFQANIQTIQTSAERFTGALEKNKLTMGEYFRYAGGASKTFGKLFKSEFETINQVARERVKDLQTQYIKLGRDANGAMKAIAVRPLALDMDNLGTRTQIAAQKQQLFNQLMKQGSTNLLNFGKNTQWAGRQLMVGFTVPLTLMGSAAAKAYMEIEKASISFRRVYGDINTTSDETEKMVGNVRKLASEFTKYGVAISDTMDMAAKAAAMGKTGADLLAQISEANRLSVLGQVDQNQALETTISLTNAFGTSTEELSSKIDFLNAVENQTVTSIEDLTIAIPKAAPVIQQLGGDVEDLTFFLTAMKEGGINASEGANALKSGLASLINPSKKASEFMNSFGISIKGIVEGNKGDVKGTVIEMAKALDTLDPLNRARAIEQMFGKFQFSRISTLFQNVIKEGSQANQVVGLASQTSEELAVLSQRELSKISDSPMFKFQKSIQDMQAKLAPVGEAFLKAVTPIVEFVTKILDGFNNLSDGTKSFITILVTAVAGIGPLLLMTFGLIANGVANIMKLFTNMKSFINKTTKPSDVLGEQTGYMTSEQLKGAAIAASLDQAHAKLRQTFTSEAGAVNELTAAYRNAIQAQQAFSGVPGVPVGDPNAMTPKKYANGVSMVPGPSGAGDIVPALLSPGEAVIPARHAKKYAPVIAGMVAGNLPGFENGTTGVGMRQSVYGPMTLKQTEGLARTGVQLKDISDEVMAGPYANVPPTNFGTQIQPTTGHSFPAFEVGGIYQKPDGTKVFVKPQIDLTGAMAEVRGTQIARDAHGLVAPKQEIRVMMDPTDPEQQRRFLVLESALDERIANIQNKFTNEEYFTQHVAALLRGDKDLGVGNLGGNVLADVGPAGVFGRASGKRALGSAVNSMEEQAIINLLGVKGGAKRFFAETTAEQISKLTPAEYDAAMKAEMARVAPKLQATIAGFGNMSPEEQAAYQAIQQRLQAGMGVDWGKYQVMHSGVKPKEYMAGVANVGKDGKKQKTGSELIIPEDGQRFAQSLQQMTVDQIRKLIPIQDSHIAAPLDIRDPKYLKQVMDALPGATPQELETYEPVSNLTAQLPGNMNQVMKPGAKGDNSNRGYPGQFFKTIWNGFENKLSKSAQIAGISLNQSQTVENEISNAIGNSTKLINDDTLAEIVGEVLGRTAKVTDEGVVKQRLLGLSQRVGGLRSKPKKAGGQLGKKLSVSDVVLEKLIAGELQWNKTTLETKNGLRFGGLNIDQFGHNSGPLQDIAARRLAQEAADKVRLNDFTKNPNFVMPRLARAYALPADWEQRSAKMSDEQKILELMNLGRQGKLQILNNNSKRLNERSNAKVGSMGTQMSFTKRDIEPDAFSQKKSKDLTTQAYDSGKLKGSPLNWSSNTSDVLNAYKLMAKPTDFARIISGSSTDFFNSLALESQAVKMAKGGIVPGATGKPKASVFDIDDTLLDLSSFMETHKAENEKLPEGQKKKWYKEVAKDPKGIPAGLAALKAAQQRGNKILLMTARPDFYEPYTRETLEKLGIDMNGIKLIARKDKDYRKPEQMKYDKTAAFMKYYDIEEFYDDMPKTRGAVSLLGVPTYDPLKLANGIFSVPGPKGAGDVVPAMLSPGEAVIPARQAAQHRPMIQQMISGNLKGYRNGTAGIGIQGFANGGIVGYEQGGYIGDSYNEGRPLPVKVMDDLSKKKDAEALRLSQLQTTAAEKVSRAADGVSESTKETRVTDKEIRKQIKEEQERAKKEEAENRRIADNQRRVAANYDQMSKEEKAKFDKKLAGKDIGSKISGAFTRNETTGKIQSAMYALTTVAGLASTIPGKVGEAAQAAMGPIGAATTAMSLIPGPAGLVVAGFAAIVTAGFQLNEHLNKLAKESSDLEKKMGTSNEAMAKFAEFSKKVTGTEAMDKRRETSGGQFFNIVQGKTTFGESYMKTDAGKDLVKSVDTEIAKGGGIENAQKLITNQLSEAIATGVLNPAQARSIAANLGTEMGDMNFGLNVSASLTDIMGPNGENLANDPLEVRMKIIQSSLEQVRGNADAMTKTGNESTNGVQAGRTAGGAVVGGAAGLATGLAVAAGATALASSGLAIAGTGTIIAGLAAAGSAVPIIGTIAGALTGMVVAGVMYQEQITKQAAALSESIQNTLEVEQQMVDSLQISYEKRIASARAAGDIAEATRLENQYLIDQGELLEANKKTNEELLKTLEDQSSGWGILFNTQVATSDELNKSIEEAYKGTGLETQAKLAREAIDNSAGTQGQENFIKSAMATKQLGISQANTASQVFGGSAEGMTNLANLLTNSPVEANRALGLSANITDTKLKEKYLTDASTMDPAKLMETNNALELANKTRGVFKGKASEAIVNFSIENEEKMVKFNQNIENLKKEKTITIGVATKFLEGSKDGMAALKSQFSRFNKYNKANKVVFMTELQQILAMKGDKDMIAAFKVWQSEQGNPTLTFADYAAYQADRTVTSFGTDNTTGAGSAQDTATKQGPDPSILDPYVKMLREANNWQQKLTVGWDASYKAIMKYGTAATKQMGGIAVLMQQQGADADIIRDFMNGTEEEQNRIIDKKTGKLRKNAGELLKKLKEIKDASEIGLSYVLATPAERLAKDNELYQAGLDVISAKEKKINEKYDARAKALDEIGKIQDKNNQRQQDTMTLADALSKGDIAAAAKAALQAKQNDQKSALDDAKSSIENARKIELEGVEVRINGVLTDRTKLEKILQDNAEKIAGFKLQEAQRASDIAKSALVSAKAMGEMLRDGKALSLVKPYNSGVGGSGNGSGTSSSTSTVKNTTATATTAGAAISGIGGAKAFGAGMDARTKAYTGKAMYDLSTTGVAAQKKILTDKQTQLKSDGAYKKYIDAYGNVMDRGQVVDQAGYDAWLKKYKAANAEVKGFDEKIATDKTTMFNNLPKEIQTALATLKSYNDQKKTAQEEVKTANETFKAAATKQIGKDAAGNWKDIGPGGKNEALYRKLHAPVLAATEKVTGIGRTIQGIDQALSAKGYLPNMTEFYVGKRYQKGGMVYASNGMHVASSKYALGTDTIPAMLTPGEFVMRKAAVDSIGPDTLNAMNNGTSVGESVYNYSITVNANSSDASGIADAVLREIQRIDSRRIRSSNI